MSTNETPWVQGSHEPPEIAVLARLAELDDGAVGVIDEAAGVKRNLERLAEEGFRIEAIRMLAHALPPRGAVWWGWGCAKQAAGDPASEEVAGCLEATEAWLADPTDTRRRAAGTAGNEAKEPTPASMAAMAVFLADGSTSPPDLPVTPPPPHVAAKLAAGAVCLAAVGGDPESIEPRLERFFRQGLEVARKSGLWEE